MKPRFIRETILNPSIFPKFVYDQEHRKKNGSGFGEIGRACADLDRDARVRQKLFKNILGSLMI